WPSNRPVDLPRWQAASLTLLTRAQYSGAHPTMETDVPATRRKSDTADAVLHDRPDRAERGGMAVCAGCGAVRRGAGGRGVQVRRDTGRADGADGWLRGDRPGARPATMRVRRPDLGRRVHQHVHARQLGAPAREHVVTLAHR